MDQTKRPLRIPPEFATYAEKHGIFDMYKRLIEQLVISKPDDPILYLINLLKRENDDVPAIVILGPPCSGKRSIAKMVCGKLRCAHLTSQNLIEEADIAIRDKARSFIQNQEPIPTEMWLKILTDRMQLYDTQKKGWVLEGFPETREQAMALQINGIYPKHCIVLEAPDTVLIERAAGKRIDTKTGDVYHTTFDWPGNPEVQERLEEPEGLSEEAMVNKLVLYHRHIDGILRCYDQVVRTVNADQPKADVYSQAFSFLCSQARSNAPHTPRVILLGPTGSGKGVQAALLANKYNLVKVSCGQLIKQAITQETKSGMAAKPYVEKDMMMPDSIVLDILKDRLCQLDCVTRGWVLSGYPRTREQAEQLDKAGLRPNRVFFLDVPNDSVLERLTLRAMDPITGERYHTLYNPPRSQEVKDRLWKNPKDGEENVRKLLSQYFAYVEELSDFYLDGQHVNADQDPHTVFECLESMICKPLPKNFY
ncbi:adenylate kinase 8 [Aplysia californica]|uniref:Adenylate kinase 8 n=1 Tax=Aplysia californica TaxID=6500 RepID=A0ABM0K4X7_APLCA|nr:adenylate kinase 8 [Aplysia californica]